MPWDDSKSTAADPDNPAADEQLSATEWNQHVTDGHFPADELNFSVDGNGDPVITDAQNADATVARFDRTANKWVYTEVNATDITATSLTTDGATVNTSVTDPAGVSHTGEIADLADVRTNEEIQDVVGTLVAGGTNVTATYDDTNDLLTVDTSALNQEEVEDAVASLLAAGGNLAWTYDDANDVLTVSLSGPITGVQIGTSATRSPAYFSSLDATSVDTDTLAGADVENAASGEVPQSQGDGSLAFGDVSGGSNIPAWTEDANSPHSFSGVSTTTFTLSADYDQILIMNDPVDLGFDSLRVNGDTGTNYDYTSNADTNTIGATEWSLRFGSYREYVALIANRAGSQIGVVQSLAQGITGEMVYGNKGSVTFPIDTFTLFDSGSTNRSGTIHVYGWNA